MVEEDSENENLEMIDIASAMREVFEADDRETFKKKHVKLGRSPPIVNRVTVDDVEGVPAVASSSGGLFECEKCDFKTKEISLMRGHRTTHNEFQCPSCEKTFELKQQLTSHIAISHVLKKGDKIHECKFCNRKFKRPYLLKQHVNSKHRKTL